MLRVPCLRALVLQLALLPGASAAAVLELRIPAGSSDAEEASSGSVALTGTDLELVEDASLQTVGLRFEGVTIPRHYVITAAWLQFQADETNSAPASLVFQGENAANAAPFTTSTRSVSSRVRTAQSVPWSPAPWTSVGAVGPAQRTPDLAAVIQPIVAGEGWASGNALALIVTGSGRRTAETFESGAPALLHLEYEPPDDFPPELTFTSPPGTAVFGLGEPVRFEASATDVEDGDLSDRIAFVSHRDGMLGIGAPFETSSLSAGPHRISAWVFDSSGQPVLRSRPVLVMGGSPRILAAGDMTACNHERDQETAQLLDGLAGLVLTLGDNAYPNGTAQEFADCYEPGWGRHKGRTRPSPGNHDFHVPGAAGYFGYFGVRAGPAPQGWYSFDYDGWHFVALNSNCAAIGGCTRTSPQGLWLEADLDENPSRCTLAYWHHARFSSSTNHGSLTATRELWRILQEHAADVVLVGHDHLYERFSKQNADGVADPLGMREFVVGTGGAGLYGHGAPEPNSELRDDTTYGVLSLDLGFDDYAWEFHPATILGGTFSDAGSASCVVRAPDVTIASPTPAAVFQQQAVISFAGAAHDAEEGDLGDALVWTSDLAGPIGTGTAFASTLECGEHLVTASVGDLHGGSGQAQVRFRIGPPGGCWSPPTGCGLGPELALVLGGLGLLSARRAGSRPRRTH